MVMGNFAHRVTVVDESFIETLPTAGPILKAWREFQKIWGIEDCAVHGASFGLDSIVEEVADQMDASDKVSDDDPRADDIESWADEFVALLERLMEAFFQDTGIRLGVEYHDHGDPYDEVDGLFWYVIDVYQLTPAAEKIKEHLRDASYTSYG